MKVDYEIPNCGTAACIGGWGITLAARMKKPLSANTKFGELGLFNRANKAFEIEEEQGERLFLISCWPSSYRAQYDEAKTPGAKAKIAAKRITHFIKTKGAE